MKFYEEKDYDALSRRAANIIAAQMTLKPDCVLGLATGSSPIGTYKCLIEKYENGDIDFSQVKTANLDGTKDSQETTTRATTISCMRICLTM